ncbi:hypothetical protein TURU_081884 [Turdus rufiventris]|nr:hypothetical protein TURU_081884 [Turdus rufiventris]
MAAADLKSQGSGVLRCSRSGPNRFRKNAEHTIGDTSHHNVTPGHTVCHWILDAWSKVTPTTIIRGFAKADIIPGFNTSDCTESAEVDDSEDEDTDDTGSGLLDAATAQLMSSDTEDEDLECFEGFTEDE